jgi:hypothetical protein
LNTQQSQQTTISRKKALAQLSLIATEAGLSTRDHEFVRSWLESVPHIADEHGIELLNVDAVRNVFQNLSEYLEHGDPNTLLQERGFIPGKIVDVIEFIESREYVGAGIKVWPGVKDNLWRIWHGEQKAFEIVLTGSIRSGKSMTAQLSTEYLLYLCSRLRDPHSRFGLSKGRSIVIVLQSTTQGKAERVLMGPMKNDIDMSPYFQRHWRRNTEINNKILMPGGIEVVPVTSSDTSAFGENVFSAVITEANAMPVVRGSVKLRHSNKLEYDTARELYNRIRERITATFNVSSDMFFGKLIVDSSVESPEDFTHQKIEEAKHDPTIMVIHKAIWEVQPPSKFPPDEPRFLVEVGDQHHNPRIVKTREEAFNPTSVIEVPIQLRKHFHADIETALKNFAGIVTAVTGAFLPYRDQINQAQGDFNALSGGKQLFKLGEISFLELFGRLLPGERPDWEQLIDYEYITQCIADTQAPFALRIDLSATGDATGLAIGRISGYREIENATALNPRSGRYEQISSAVMPHYHIDGLLRIVAKHGEEIDPNLVADIGIEINRHINIKWATSDRAESSRAILIRWRNAGIFSDFLSVDTDLRPMTEIKNAIREQRIMFPTHETADRELKRLRKIVQGKRIKIDHPDTPGASKDLADAMAGAVFMLFAKEAQKHIRLSEEEGSAKENQKMSAVAGGRRGYGPGSRHQHAGTGRRTAGRRPSAIRIVK